MTDQEVTDITADVDTLLADSVHAPITRKGRSRVGERL